MKYLIARISRSNEWATEPDLLVVAVNDEILDRTRVRNELATANRILDPEFEGSRYHCSYMDIFPISLTSDDHDDILDGKEWTLVGGLDFPHTPWEEYDSGEVTVWSAFFDGTNWLMFSGFGDASGDLYESPIGGINVVSLIKAYYARVSGDG